MARQTPKHPWFLYLAYNAPHFPLAALRESTKHYRRPCLFKIPHTIGLWQRRYMVGLRPAIPLLAEFLDNVCMLPGEVVTFSGSLAAGA